MANFPWKREFCDGRVTGPRRFGKNVGGVGVLGSNTFRSSVFRESWALKGMLVVRWLTARPAIEDIEARRKALIVETYAERKIEDLQGERMLRIAPE
jgi:hypothetical protein